MCCDTSCMICLRSWSDDMFLWLQCGSIKLDPMSCTCLTYPIDRIGVRYSRDMTLSKACNKGRILTMVAACVARMASTCLTDFRPFKIWCAYASSDLTYLDLNTTRSLRDSSASRLTMFRQIHSTCWQKCLRRAIIINDWPSSMGGSLEWPYDRKYCLR